MRELPQGWTQLELGALADVAIGGTPSRDIPRYWAGNDIDGKPWVAISDLHGRVIDFTSESITEAGIANSNVKLVKHGTVLMSFKLSLGRVAFAGCDLYTNEAIAAFLVNDQVTPAYLYYALPDAVRGAATDVAIKGATLNKKSLRKLVISHPSPKAQEKIATILSTIDTAIEQTEALIEKYQHIKAGLMHDLFTRGVLPNGQLRPPREQAPELYQETAIGWIPREWQVSELEKACRTIVDCPHSTPSFQPGGVLVARTMHIKNGVFLEDDASRVSEKEYQERIARAEPTPGDVILTREAPVGEAFVIPPAMKICLGQRVMLIKPNTALLDSDYLVAQIYSGALSTRIGELTAGTTNPHLNVADVRSLLLALPPFTEQQELTRRINAMNRKIHNQQEISGKLKLQKLGLMQDLLTGKVPVSVDVAPSEALA